MSNVLYNAGMINAANGNSAVGSTLYSIGIDSNGGCVTYDSSISPSSIVKCDDLVLNNVSIAETISKIRERLLILEPKKELLEKYNALKEAYDHFKLLEKLLTESDS